MASDIRGLVTNIQDYAVHDGYGLRSIVFLKGCPLRCGWCQNPECVKSEREVMFRRSMCIDCKRCLEACPLGAIKEDLEGRIDRTVCDGCMRCVDACPSAALSAVGVWFSVEQVIRTLLAYKAFYDGSDKGGVTLSGGEPLFQPEFALSLLRECKEQGIHTALETCGYTSYHLLSEACKNLDLLLYDIKHMDDERHKAGTGVSNVSILDNLARLRRDAGDLECVIRIPLIPGFNDYTENIEKTAEFVASLGIQQIDVLPFNELASAKYREIGERWTYADVKRQKEEALTKITEIIRLHGLKVTVGGLW